MRLARGVRRVSCRVEFYAGSKAEETPRRVHCQGKDMNVDEVLGRRRVMDKASGRTTEEFTLVLDGRIARIRRTISGRWSLLLPLA